jgi:putative CocE/NonD family hydrolase
VAVLTAVAGCAGPETSPATVVFDAYSTGVALAEVVVSETSDGVTYAIRVRTPATLTWSDAVVSTEQDLDEFDSESLPRPLRRSIRMLARVAGLNWSGASVPWPEAGVEYDRHRQIETRVNGRTLRGTYWAVRDGTRPTDLVIGENGDLLAAISPSTDHVLVRRGYEGFTTVERWRAPTVSQPEYGYRELEPEMVGMRDGIRLATRVYLPAADGPFPTIFVRTPYGLTGLIGNYFHYAMRGFAVVLQAARGTSYMDPTNRSEGVWHPMINEPADGADALEWITEQGWSNGDVCMQGGSYVGYTQWATTMADNPSLKCVVPESSMGTAFSDQPFMGGGMVLGMAYYMFWMLDRPILPDRTWSDILAYRPLIDLDEYATGEDIPQWNDMLDHWRNDEYWAPQDWYAAPGERAFSTLQISGWWDDDYPGTQSNWELMQRTSSAPQRLILGPWKHGYNADRALNGYRFGVDALRDDIWLAKQAMYDRFLKGIDNGVEGRVVDYFVLGDDEWRRSSSWPPEEVDEQAWYFHSDGSAASTPTGGSLTVVAPDAVEAPDTFRYDPDDPPANWYTFDDMESWQDVQSFPFDARSLESRDDVAVFTSAPLETDLTIAGPIVVEIYASTDVLDTDWWAHLADVGPSGESTRLSTGLIRARFRNLDDPVHKISGSNFTTEEFLSGDVTDVVRFRFSLPSIANTFKAGHRVRIAVMNALDNYSFPNSNTGEHEAYVSRTVVGTMSLHHSPDRASHVVLPVVPR